MNGTLRCETPAQADKVRAALYTHIQLTRAEPGCVSFEVSATEDPLVWTVAEEFTDTEAFEAHQERTKASDWALKTAGIPRDYTITGLE
ncbi:Antibiotic biosynthesis monooxygenase [Sulfitobacter noctilucae]|nr:Antibiotic biosynthesis monooxygenase [Sulfitobacter noctilucae]